MFELKIRWASLKDASKRTLQITLIHVFSYPILDEYGSAIRPLPYLAILRACGPSWYHVVSSCSFSSRMRSASAFCFFRIASSPNWANKSLNRFRLSAGPSPNRQIGSPSCLKIKCSNKCSNKFKNLNIERRLRLSLFLTIWISHSFV